MNENYTVRYLVMGEWNDLRNIDKYELSYVISALSKQDYIDKVEISKEEENQ